MSAFSDLLAQGAAELVGMTPTAAVVRIPAGVANNDATGIPTVTYTTYTGSVSVPSAQRHHDIEADVGVFSVVVPCTLVPSTAPLSLTAEITLAGNACTIKRIRTGGLPAFWSLDVAPK